jgi:hypothetical protein
MARTLAIFWLLVLTASSWVLFNIAATSNINGIVFDDTGPVAQAHVGVQGECGRILTNAHGRFRLPALPRPVMLIANKPGYRIASAPSTSPVLLLQRLPRKDNRDYQWIEPHADPAKVNNCANCHAEIYGEWKSSAHANSASNPKFLHLFAGTDGKTPMQKQWNARVEHPDGAAVCASCHVPTLQSATLNYDVRDAKGDARSGIHCDYCHKVTDVTDKLGTRFGRDALELLRPASGDAISYGPLDDAVRKDESFAKFPVYQESHYCASCHEGTVFGVQAYSTYSEWLESPAKQRGQQCQSCHMAPTGTMTNIAPGHGGITRKASTLASHHTLGGERGMLMRSLAMTATAKSVNDGMGVEVELVARNVGHRVPTGFVDRHLVLVVRAFNGQHKSVDLTAGPTLPTSTGKWAGLAGTLHAKLLIGEGNRTPSPFWLPVFGLVDTRLKPDEPERRSFVFTNDARRATVQLWYRRFWQEVADARGWSDNDLLVQEIQLTRD